MVLVRSLSFLVVSFLCLGCQIPYIVQSGYHQSKILAQRESLQKVLSKDSVSDEIKRKIRLAQEAKVFSEKVIGLKATDNYTSYVDLKRPYVSWIVQAAHEYELKAYLWNFPLVGALPYKGYFTEAGAKKEASTFDTEKFDVYVRGVTAYSTLGWFSDPLLNTMMNYSDADLVELIIHESVHATLYIKSEAEFNERLATYIGQLGAEKFFKEKEGPESRTLKQIQLEREDSALFSEFISNEIESLEKWYADHHSDITPEMKEKRLKEIQKRFQNDMILKFKTEAFYGALRGQLNNAILVGLKTYQKDLKDFESLYEKLGKNIEALIVYSRTLEDKENPSQVLKDFLKRAD